MKSLSCADSIASAILKARNYVELYMEYMWNTADQNSVDSAFPKRFQEMAFAMPNGSASTAAIDEGFFCPVCLEILQDPTSIPCGHT